MENKKGDIKEKILVGFMVMIVVMVAVTAAFSYTVFQNSPRAAQDVKKITANTGQVSALGVVSAPSTKSKQLSTNEGGTSKSTQTLDRINDARAGLEKLKLDRDNPDAKRARELLKLSEEKFNEKEYGKATDLIGRVERIINSAEAGSLDRSNEDYDRIVYADLENGERVLGNTRATQRVSNRANTRSGNDGDTIIYADLDNPASVLGNVRDGERVVFRDVYDERDAINNGVTGDGVVYTDSGRHALGGQGNDYDGIVYTDAGAEPLLGYNSRRVYNDLSGAYPTNTVVSTGVGGYGDIGIYTNGVPAITTTTLGGYPYTTTLGGHGHGRGHDRLSRRERRLLRRLGHDEHGIVRSLGSYGNRVVFTNVAGGYSLGGITPYTSTVLAPGYSGLYADEVAYTALGGRLGLGGPRIYINR